MGQAGARGTRSYSPRAPLHTLAFDALSDIELVASSQPEE